MSASSRLRTVAPSASARGPRGALIGRLATAGVALGAAIGCLALLTSAPAHAYVPGGEAVVRRSAEQRHLLRLYSLQVQGYATLEGPLASALAAQLEPPEERETLQTGLTLYMRLPGRCRLELTPTDGPRVTVVQSYGRRRQEGPELEPLQRLVGDLCALLGTRSQTGNRTRPEIEADVALTDFVRSKRVDLGRSTLGRQDGKVVYLLGQSGERTPQLMVYKESLQPGRLRYLGEDGALWELRLRDYESPFAGSWFPRELELYRDGVRLFSATITLADGRTAVPEELF